MRQLFAECIIARPGHGTAMPDGVITIDDGTIVAVASQTGTAQGRGMAVMPALANAHDHGRGLSTLLTGASDQALEGWLPALAGQPMVDPYAVNALAFARMARSGCSSILHCHVPQNFSRLREEAAVVAQAAADIGVRLAFVVPLRDRNRLVIGDNDAFLDRCDADLRAAISQRWLAPLPDAREQLALTEAIANDLKNPGFDVQYGPVAPHWCSDALLAGVAEESARSGRRIHMHLLETRLQREWADTTYKEGLIAHLDSLGLLSPRLTVAHCVWLRPAEMELLAERGVTVVINTSSNLRLRSGTAPLRQFHKAGLAVACGLDGLGLDDDTDMLREVRLAALSHAGIGLDEGVAVDRLLDGVFATGHHVAGGASAFGAVVAGNAADLVVLDFGRLTFGSIPGAVEAMDAVLGRATRRHVRGLIVGGRDVVVDGRVTGIDEDALAADLDRSARLHADTWRQFAPLYARFRALILDHYRHNKHLGPLALS